MNNNKANIPTISISKCLELVDVYDTLRFCQKYWDTYGFDYDTERPWLIWPLDQTMEELKQALEADNIKAVDSFISFDLGMNYES